MPYRTNYIKKAPFTVFSSTCSKSTAYTVLCTDTVQSTDPQNVLKNHVSLSFFSEAPPVRLKKYTYKQVLNLVNSLEGNDYTEVLTLTREEKDKQREEGKLREEARTAEISANAPPTKKRKPKGEKALNQVRTCLKL